MAIALTKKVSAKNLLEKLASRPSIGGLLITDAALQYAVMKDGAVETHSVKLPPGAIVNGKVVNEEQLLLALIALKKEVDPHKKVAMQPVVLVIPSSSVFIQSFKIPKSDKQIHAESSVALNLQMISPVEPERAYSSYEILKENEDSVEYLGAIAEKEVVEKYLKILESSAWYGIAVECSARSLTRLVAADSASVKEIILLIHISSDGIELSLLKERSLAFTYFHAWSSIQGNERQIRMSDFEATLTEQIRRVLTFCFAKFSATISKVLCVSPGVEADVSRILKQNFSLDAEPLNPGLPVSPVWFVSCGAAYRGLMSRRLDRELNLGGIGTMNLYYREQLLEFLRMWRNVVLVTGCIFVFIFVGIYVLLKKTEKNLDARLTEFKVGSYSEKLNILQEKVNEFNSLVSAVKSIKKEEEPLFQIYEEFKKVADSMKIKFDSFVIQGLESSVTVSSRATSYASITQFKNSLVEHPKFSDVSVPLNSVSAMPDGFIGFSVSFRPKPGAWTANAVNSR